MTQDLVNLLLAGIKSSRLLDQAKLDEITSWAAERSPTPAELVKEIRRRALLTDFQLKEISRGRGAELVLGPYQLQDLVGAGGMGQVFKALHTRLNRIVAVKVIRKEKLSKSSVVQRFQQEIRAVAQLSHPNVVLALDADEANGVHYYAMEYVEGMDLTKAVEQNGPMAIDQACQAIRQAALGLQHAYERGLVHRDVKPSNLMRTSKGQVKLLDLGLAMLNTQPHEADAEAHANRLTQEGLVLGTPDFLAPEQALNPMSVDIRADIYALGATLYYLLTGKVPFPERTPSEKMVQHLTAAPPNLLDHRADAPPELDGLIKWLMNKRPEDRAQTPLEVANALQPFCQPTAVSPVFSPAEASFAALATTEAQPEVQFTPEPLVSSQSLPSSTSPSSGYQATGYQPRGYQAKTPSKFPTALVLMLGLGGLGLTAAAAIGFVFLFPAEPDYGPLSKEFTTPQGITMIRLEGGTVTLGSSQSEPGREPHEAAPSTIELSGPFYMSATEITNGQFRAVMGKSPARWAPRLKDSKNAPVDNVTFEEAIEFCKTLHKLDGATRRPGWGYRLPTEAEWEYACRAGSNEPFSFGDTLIYGKYALFSLDRDEASDVRLGEEDLSKTKMERNLPYPVRSTVPNDFGLFDMHGNVWEWVNDYYEPQPNWQGKDPSGPAEGFNRVLKGGSWQEPASRCRSASRAELAPQLRKDDVGFRIVFAKIRKAE